MNIELIERETPAVDRSEKGLNARPLIERFIEKIQVNEPCWVWTGAVNANGYGSMWDGEKAETASRLAYRLLIGPINDGLFVLHRCDNPLCVKPSHLFLGTHTENMRDRDMKGRCAKAFGARNPMAKLTEEQAREIKLSSLPASHYVEKFSISAASVSRIRKGEGWKHL